MRGKLRSNLPLRLALAFDELAPKVPILLLLRSQPLQWRSPWAVRASSHRHWTIHRPRGTGGLTRRSTYRPRGRNTGIAREEEEREDGEKTEKLLDLLDAFVCQMVKRRRGSYIDDLPHCILQFEYLNQHLTLTCGGHVRKIQFHM